MVTQVHIAFDVRNPQMKEKNPTVWKKRKRAKGKEVEEEGIK